MLGCTSRLGLRPSSKQCTALPTEGGREQRLHFYIFELVWHTTGQYSVIGLRETCKFIKNAHIKFYQK